MHFVCALYASPTAYIFVPSALRTRLFAFLYALYAVNSGVVSSHRVHSRFFDAYNAYKSHELAVCRDHRTWRRPDLKERAMKLDGVRECLKSRAVEDECLKSRTVEDRGTDNIKK